MKSKVIGIVLIAVSFILIGCGNNYDKAKQNTENKSVVNNIDINKEANDNVPMNTKKTYYLNQFKKMKNKSEDLYYGKETNNEIRAAQNEDFKMWDNKVSEIYNYLEKNINSSEFEKIKKDEIKWIDLRDKKAQETAKHVKGGILEPIAYTGSLIRSTEKRCYELVNKYMK